MPIQVGQHRVEIEANSRYMSLLASCEALALL